MNTITLIDKIFYLKRTPMFRMLTMEMLLPIADKLVAVSFDKDDILFDIGDEAHRMYFIVDGWINIYSLDSTNPVHLEAGSFFGEESLFNEKRRAYRAVAAKDTDILTLSQTNLITIISEYPNVALGFLSVFATALQDRAKLPIRDIS